MNIDTPKTLENTFCHHSLVVVPVIYFVMGLFIIAINMGAHPWAAVFSSFMERIIPSIAGTALYSPQPDNARLILSLAWFFIPVCVVTLHICHRGKSFQWERINKRKITLVLAIIFGLILLEHMATHTPTPIGTYTGRSARFFYRMISSSTISLLLLETGFVLAFGSMLYISFRLPIEAFRRTFKGEKS